MHRLTEMPYRFSGVRLPVAQSLLRFSKVALHVSKVILHVSEVALYVSKVALYVPKVALCTSEVALYISQSDTHIPEVAPYAFTFPKSCLSPLLFPPDFSTQAAPRFPHDAYAGTYPPAGRPSPGIWHRAAVSPLPAWRDCSLRTQCVSALQTG